PAHRQCRGGSHLAYRSVVHCHAAPGVALICRRGPHHALIGFRGLMLQALFEKHNSFLRPLKKKGFKEERVTTIGWYDIGKSHDPGIQQEPWTKRSTSLAHLYRW